MKKQVELLAPAGNFSKLKTALYYGADAVYVGGKAFSLRALADNFSDEELKEAVLYCHERGKKIYVAVNIFAKNSDLERAEKYFSYLEEIGVDAAIISDPALVYAAKKSAKNLHIHISTQANITSKYAVKFWGEQGAERCILARELSLKEIKEIHEECPEIELEAFVHGAMCISYSGRCLLSNYLSGRESNRGACVQACRWKYEIRATDSKNEGGWLEMQQDERGTYILNSKDLNMSEYLDEMISCGVCSFKIEGRMKSEYYLATVINAYRRAIDGQDMEMVARELATAAHREYTTAYMLGDNDKTVNYDDTQTKGDCDYIAGVIGVDGEFIKVEMRNRFKSGDTLEILSPDENFSKSFVVGEMYAPNGNLCDDAKLVQGIYRLRCSYKLHEGDILRRRK